MDKDNNTIICDKFIKIMYKKNLLLTNHSKNVCEIVLKICKQMGLKEKEIEIIKTAALLHDIGKIFIDNIILDKPSSLDDLEFDMIKEHPANGAELAKLFVKDNHILEIIKCHHERIDGNGYPDGLKAKEIPLGAKIITIADAYDAMATRRPYKKETMSKYDSLIEIERCSGSQFDKYISELFVKMIIKDDLISIIK